MLKKAVLLHCFVETMINLRFLVVLIHNRNIFVTMYIFYCQFQSINFYIEIKVITIIFLNSSIRSKISIELECLQKVFNILDMYTVQLVIRFSNAFSQRKGHEVFIIRIIGGIIVLSNLQWDHHLQKVNPPKFLHSITGTLYMSVMKMRCTGVRMRQMCAGILPYPVQSS